MDLTKPSIMKTKWMDLPSEPQDGPRPRYTSTLALLGDPKEPSYSHPKVLGRYFDHVYHQGWYIKQLNRKSWDKFTSHNQDVYNQELNENLSYIRGIGELNVVHWKPPVPASLMNPEIILPTMAFKAALGKKERWMDDSWSCDGEVPWTYILDGCEAQVDWCAGEKSLKRPKDTIDEADWEQLYLQDCNNEMLELEGSVYDRLGATPASMTISTNTEAATKMFGLSMGMLGTPVCSTLETLPNLQIQILAMRSVETVPTSVDRLKDLVATVTECVCKCVSWNDTLQAAEQFKDMFKVLNLVPRAVPSPRVDDDDIKVLMAEARAQSLRKLPPPLGLPPPLDNTDKQNVVLQSLKKSNASVATGSAVRKSDESVVGEVVLDPTNWDPLYLAWDAAIDAVWDR